MHFMTRHEKKHSFTRVIVDLTLFEHQTSHLQNKLFFPQLAQFTICSHSLSVSGAVERKLLDLTQVKVLFIVSVGRGLTQTLQGANHETS